MNRCHRILFIAALLGILATSAFAMPEFLENFRKDPFRRSDVDGCGTCHMSAEGGDERNAFGQAFEKGGYLFTPMLRAQFPDRFAYAVSRLSDTLVIHFSDPANRQMVVESAGAKMLIDVEKKAVDGRAATIPGTGPAFAILPSAAPPGSESSAPVPRVSAVTTDRYSREGAFFGSRVVNLPNGKPQRAGGVDFFIGHRFTQPIFPIVSDETRRGSIGDLFGFDSSTVVTYGVNVGITGRISVAATRENLFKTIEISSAVQVSRQNGTSPLTLQIRGGVEGRNNFQDRFSPYLQIVSVRTLFDRLSFVFAPTFAFNTRNEESPFFPNFVFGREHNHTTALGAGIGFRFLPTTSLVAEYIPRAHGFRGEMIGDVSRPGVSIGIQKGTFRHTFEFVLSTQTPLTPAQYSVSGTDKFRAGFNIYRKLR